MRKQSKEKAVSLLATQLRATHNGAMRPLFICFSGACLLTVLAGCFGGNGATRSWIDSRTAVTVTAQARPIVLSREDFPAGVNVRDYAELGAFEINRSGARKRYLALVLWSTVDRKPAEQAQIEAAFDSMTLWADDRPILLKRSSASHESLLVSNAVLDLPSPAASETYYEISTVQLTALANAQRLTLSPSGMTEGERAYTLWRGTLTDLSRFIAELPLP